MKTKATILTFLFYTVVSGHEEEVDDTSRLATLGVSRRFGSFHRLGSPFTAPAPADTSVEAVNQPRSITTNETHYPLRGHIIVPSEQADKRLAMATNIQDEDVEEIPSRYLHTQSRNRNRNRNRARKNNAAARARARARARRRRRRRRNRNRRNRNRNRLFTDKSYVKETNRLFVRESTQQQQSSTEQVEVTENLGGCSGAEGSICAIFYPGAPPAPPSTSSPPEIPDLPDEFPEQQNKAFVPPDDPTELPTAPTFEWIKLDERQHRAYDYFGYCVAIDENTIVVGSPSSVDQAWLNTGFASVFYRGNNGWELQQDLQPPIEVGPGDLFGYSVGLWASNEVSCDCGGGIVGIETRGGGGGGTTGCHSDGTSGCCGDVTTATVLAVVGERPAAVTVDRWIIRIQLFPPDNKCE